MTLAALRRNDLAGALALYGERRARDDEVELRGLREMLAMLQDEPDRFLEAAAAAPPAEA